MVKKSDKPDVERRTYKMIARIVFAFILYVIKDYLTTPYSYAFLIGSLTLAGLVLIDISVYYFFIFKEHSKKYKAVYLFSLLATTVILANLVLYLNVGTTPTFWGVSVTTCVTFVVTLVNHLLKKKKE